MTKKFLAFGCSHTAGAGISLGEIYVDILGNSLGLSCQNLAVSGANSSECVYRFVDAVNHDSDIEFIVAQWPNIYRRSLWIGDEKYFQNTNVADESFHLLLKYSSRNFVEPWVENIVLAHTLARALGIDIYHIYLDRAPPEITELESKGIKLYCDEPRPGHSWIFDSAASDDLHHSSRCHQRWAERLEKIINENTSR